MLRSVILMGGLFAFFCSPLFAQSVERSMIGASIIIPLEAIRTRAQMEIPARHDGPARREICVPAERACTKIPEFRGLKIYSRMECIDITPRISCDISETVVREGPIQIRPVSGGLDATQVVSGTVTGRGRGTIGKNIRQSVRGTAEVTATIRPTIDADWTLDPGLSISHRWTSRPTVRLFNLIPITVGGEVDKAIDRAKANLPGELRKAVDDFDLRGRMATLWDEMQEPVLLEIDGADGSVAATAYLHTRPKTVDFSGIMTDAAAVRATIRVGGEMRVTDSEASPWGGTTSLPALGSNPGDGGFAIAVPVRLGWDRLNEALAAELPREITIDGAKATIHAASLASGENGRLLATLNATVPTFGRVKATLAATPTLDEDSQALRLAEMEVRGDNLAGQVAAFVAGNTGLIADQFDVSLVEPLADATRALGAGLFGSDGGVRRTGDVSLAISSLNVDRDGLSVTAQATGQIEIALEIQP